MNIPFRITKAGLADPWRKPTSFLSDSNLEIKIKGFGQCHSYVWKISLEGIPFSQFGMLFHLWRRVIRKTSVLAIMFGNISIDFSGAPRGFRLTFLESPSSGRHYFFVDPKIRIMKDFISKLYGNEQIATKKLIKWEGI